MEEQYISFDTAKLAKEKGFDEPCIEFYNPDGKLLKNAPWRTRNFSYPTNGENLSAPRLSFLQKWLREKHNISVEPYEVLTYSGRSYVETNNNEYSYKIIKNGIPIFVSNNENYKTYEEAFEIGLQEALKLIES